MAIVQLLRGFHVGYVDASADAASETTERIARCTGCGEVRRLRSMNTRSALAWFTIPFWRRGPVRVVDACSCTRHAQMPLDAWQKQIGELVTTHTRALSGDSAGPAAAIAALADACGAGDLAAFRELVALARPRCAGDAAALRALAAAYVRFEMADHAVAALDDALATNVDLTPTRAALASVHARLLEPARAERYLDELWQEPNLDDVRLLVADAYQARGLAADASALLDKTERNTASAEVRAAIVAARTRMARGFGSPQLHALRFRKTIPPPKRIPLTPRQKWQLIAVLGGSAAIAGVVDAGASLIVHATRPLYVVNGLDQGVNITIDGSPVALAPHETATIRIGEGSHHVTGADGAVTDIDMESNPLLRPLRAWRVFEDDVFILNPDHTAVLVFDTMKYGAGDGDGYTWDAMRAPVFGSFRADIAFADFPPTIDTRSSPSRERSRVLVASLDTLKKRGGHDDLVAEIEKARAIAPLVNRPITPPTAAATNTPAP
ncbi:MAG TPA: hypothetical protein VGO62_09010 [Myxococcota bacterium]|jgi:hypothetical protein